MIDKSSPEHLLSSHLHAKEHESGPFDRASATNRRSTCLPLFHKLQTQKHKKMNRTPRLKNKPHRVTPSDWSPNLPASREAKCQIPREGQSHNYPNTTKLRNLPFPLVPTLSSREPHVSQFLYYPHHLLPHLPRPGLHSHQRGNTPSPTSRQEERERDGLISSS